jgi:hypothetical protein
MTMARDAFGFVTSKEIHTGLADKEKNSRNKFLCFCMVTQDKLICWGKNVIL